MKTKIKPIGSIELETGEKDINILNDIFLNYIFNKKENWELLKDITNIFLEDYISKNPNTVLLPIKGEVEVITQYKYLLEPNKNKTRNQDLKIKSKDEINFLEIQNKVNTKIPIPRRALEYFGLSVARNIGDPANQIWLLAEDVPELLKKKSYTNYIFEEENTNENYPLKTSILFVSLQKLQRENSKVGELTKMLFGEKVISNEEVKKISNSIEQNFKIFKMDKEAKQLITYAERWKEEAYIEGIEQGIEQGKEEIFKKSIMYGIKYNLPKEYFEGLAKEAGISKEHASFLYNKLKGEVNI